MLLIQKGPEPRTLSVSKQPGLEEFDAVPRDVKQAIRDALVDEQRGLCCYCMRRIDATAAGMKIEHFESRANLARQLS